MSQVRLFAMPLKQDADNADVCLLCCRTCKTNDGKFEDETETDKLDDQIFVMFLLRNVLKMPKSFCETLLATEGNPSQWIFCCTSCSITIRDIQKSLKELIVIQKKYDLLRQKAYLIFENSKSVINTKCDENILTQRSRSSNKIRRFILSEGNDDSPSRLQKDLIVHEDKQIKFYEDELYFIKEEAGEIEKPEDMLQGFGNHTVEDYYVEGKDDSPSRIQQDLIVHQEKQINWNDDELIFIKAEAGEIEESEEMLQDFGDETIDGHSVQNKLVAEDCRSSAEIKDCNSGANSDWEFENDEDLHRRKIKAAPLDNTPSTKKEKSKTKTKKCSFCDKSFKKPSHLKDHLRIHTGEKPYKCSECGKCFSQKSNLTSHMKYQSGEIPLACSECRKVFPCKNSLISHIRVHTGEKPFGCAECEKTFSTKYQLTAHMKIHTGDYLSLESKPPLDNTPSTENEYLKAKTNKCSFCDKSFKKPSHLKDHLRIHTGEKPYKCSECGKCFSQKSNLTSHMKYHSGEMPYACSECGKVFPCKNSLISHRWVHTGEKPFGCAECEKTFSTKYQLTTHMKIHTGDLARCSECGKGFIGKNVLANHMKVHTGEKPFSCSECGKSFPRKSYLKYHMRFHTGEKPYQCSDCGRTFTWQSSLTDHAKTHTRREKSFDCTECEKAFTRKRDLTTHMKIHTGKINKKTFTHQQQVDNHSKIHPV